MEEFGMDSGSWRALSGEELQPSLMNWLLQLAEYCTVRAPGQEDAVTVLQERLASLEPGEITGVLAGQSCPGSPPAVYLALAQGNGRELFGELHLFSKLVKVGSWVSAWGQHKHERGGGAGLPEHDGEVGGLQHRQLVVAQGL